MLSLTLLFCSISLFASASFAIEIPTLTVDNFKRLVNDTDDAWVIFFHDNSKQCKQLMKEYKKAADVFRGVVNFGAVNAKTQRPLSKRYEDFLPTLKYFVRSKEIATNFNSSLTFAAMVNFTLREIERKADGEEVYVLQDKWFAEDFSGERLTAYYAPQDVRCTNFSFEWTKLARNLDGKIRTETINCADRDFGECTEGELPQVYYHLDSASSSRYRGKHTAVDMKRWYMGRKKVASQPEPKVAEIVDQTSILRTCQFNSFCVASFLPDLTTCPYDCRQMHLRNLAALQSKYRLNNWGFMWAEAGAQHEIEEAFKSKGRYPFMVAVEIMQAKYYKHEGDFSAEALGRFLNRVDRGQAESFALDMSRVPTIFKTGMWKGKAPARLLLGKADKKKKVIEL